MGATCSQECGREIQICALEGEREHEVNTLYGNAQGGGSFHPNVMAGAIPRDANEMEINDRTFMSNASGQSTMLLHSLDNFQNNCKQQLTVI